LAGLTDPADVAVTLVGWLASPPAGIDRHRLDPLLPSLYPPRWGLPAEQPALQRVLPGHTGWVAALAFSPHGRRLASAAHDGPVRLWTRPPAPSWPPSRATTARCTRWRSARTGSGWPPPVPTGRCGCGTPPPAPS